MINRVILNERSYFGRGSRKKILEEIKERGLRRILIITDHNLVREGIVDMIIKDFDRSTGVSYLVFDNVKENPTVSIVKEGVEVAKHHGSDAILAIGGGSVIDAAKAIGIILTNPEFENVVSLENSSTKNKSLPLIAVPTTSGTAAEVTINYVITDEKRVKKMVCVDPNTIPLVAIIDPDLMEKMPKVIAASTGMDALTHAIEGYLTKNAWMLPDMFHINAMAIIYKNLERAVINKDPKSIEKVAYAQYIAGMGFSNAGLGITHSLAHSLGAYYDTPHGIANAILLPHVLKFNGKECPELFLNIGNAFGLNMKNLNNDEIVDKVVAAIKKLEEKLDIPKNLEEIGISKEMLPTLAKQAINDVCTSGNPRKVTISDLVSIYEKAYK